MNTKNLIRRMPSHLVFVVPLVLGVTRSEDVSVYPEAGPSTSAFSARQSQVENESVSFGHPDAREAEVAVTQVRREASDECGSSLSVIARLVACRSADLWKALP